MDPRVLAGLIADHSYVPEPPEFEEWRIPTEVLDEYLATERSLRHLVGKGFHIYMRGEAVDGPPDGKPGLYHWWRQASSEHPHRGLRLWVRELRLDGLAAYLEQSWPPSEPERIAVRGLEATPSVREAVKQSDQIMKGYCLLRWLDNWGGGRPENDGLTFRSDLIKAWKAVAAEWPTERPTQARVAEKMSMEARWFQRQFAEHVGGKWKDYRPS